jgi:hypothetical protein
MGQGRDRAGTWRGGDFGLDRGKESTFFFFKGVFQGDT